MHWSEAALNPDLKIIRCRPRKRFLYPLAEHMHLGKRRVHVSPCTGYCCRSASTSLRPFCSPGTIYTYCIYMYMPAEDANTTCCLHKWTMR